jgi:hypothetical protein
MKKLAIVLTGLVGIALLSGCRINNPNDPFGDAMDGSGGFVASDLTSMGSDAGDLLSPAASAKMSATPETLYIIKVIVPWAYDAVAGCWTRSAETTYENGTRVRCDTVWFKDANNLAVHTPSMATVASYRHVRSVTAKFSNLFAFRWEMNVAIMKNASDTTFVFNGGGTGSFNGDVFRSTTVTNVTSQWLRSSIPHMQFPSGGTIRIDRLLRTINVVFNGNGNATATVTRKKDNKTVVYNIQVQTGRESQ